MLHFLNLAATDNNFRLMMGRFKCQRCGKCCQSIGGQLLKRDEGRKLAEVLGCSFHQFKDRFTFTREGERFLNTPCPFLGESGCTIYRNRPQVCQEFPFNKVYTHKDGRKFMTVANCPAGRVIGEKYGVKG